MSKAPAPRKAELHWDGFMLQLGEPNVTYTRSDLAAPRVKKLEWKGTFAYNGMGGYYHLKDCTGGNTALYFHAGSSKAGLAVSDEFWDLDTIAQAHHEKLALSMLETSNE